MEDFRIERMSKGMTDFAFQAARGEAHEFNLRGPVNVPTYLQTHLGLFSVSTLAETSLILVSSLDINNPAFLTKIKGLILPERIQGLQIQDNPVQKAINMMAQAIRGLPYLMISEGITRDTRKEVIMLYAVLGYSPQTALDALKNRIWEYQVKQN